VGQPLQSAPAGPEHLVRSYRVTGASLGQPVPEERGGELAKVT
jgi:hypothetical protein